ncbi:hypothetical protein [Microbacterium sp.]|uniref:hypothetical protein n=1 Tax=Microbacterium sp. TaxID=51671 RepID=UPI000925D57C|nr:hypothetical protein [Microbacterium sp.]MBN9193789.1 hypothetical protein [Microbacterium sp.]OJU66290.1 MAG: hypothetical protein BGO04_13845 [Microbacterium sp. 70-38]
MSSHVETSPGGIGFIRTTAQKPIPGEPNASRAARRRSWLTGQSKVDHDIRTTDVHRHVG